ncbi:MAG: hypothetical protein WCL32_06235 [Planctomycetota bacterium]|jgi:tetratricopeptide (TPR) repeat protein
MADSPEPLPKLTPEQRQNVAKSFMRAKQVLASGNLDYAIELLIDCCKRDPASIPFRQELRRSEKLKYKDNKKGKPLAFLSTWRTSLTLETAFKRSKYLNAIEAAEEILRHNPWHTRAHIVSAASFEKLGLNDLALWTLDQARQIDDKNPVINRLMAQMFEARGQFNQAMALWKLVAQKLPNDKEAAKKSNDLAASATIAKGKYGETSTGQSVSPAKKDVGPAERPPEEGEASTMAEQRIAKEAAMFLARIEESPNVPQTYLSLVQLYRRNDFADKAREIVKKGLAATKNHFDLALEAADLEIDPFRRDLALCEQQMRDDPKNTSLAATRTKLLKDISVRELAFYRQKSDRYPTDGAARFEMSVRLYKVGQYNEAITELQKVRNDPKHKNRVLIYLGFCFKSLNNWRLAQRNFEDAMQHLGPAEESYRKELMYQLATGYSENGEMPRAIELGCELANLDYSYKNIGALIDKWQTKK